MTELHHRKNSSVIEISESINTALTRQLKSGFVICRYQKSPLNSTVKKIKCGKERPNPLPCRD